MPRDVFFFFPRFQNTRLRRFVPRWLPACTQTGDCCVTTDSNPLNLKSSDPSFVPWTSLTIALDFPIRLFCLTQARGVWLALGDSLRSVNIYLEIILATFLFQLVKKLLVRIISFFFCLGKMQFLLSDVDSFKSQIQHLIFEDWTRVVKRISGPMRIHAQVFLKARFKGLYINVFYYV